MKMGSVRKEYFNRLRNGFVFFYLLYLALCMFIPLRLVTEPISSYLYTAFSFVAVIIMFLELWIYKEELKRIEYIFPFFFILVGSISTIVNYHYELLSNIKALALMTAHFVFFYMLNTHWENDKSKELVAQLMQGFLATWFVSSTVSVAEFVVGYSNVLDSTHGELSGRRLGFYEQRLFGAFGDPNYASVLSVVAICFCAIFLTRKGKKTLLKTYYIINIIVQWIYIVLSGSRTALLSICVSVGTVVLIFLWNYLRKKGWACIQYILIPILISIFCVGVTCGIYSLTKDVVSYVPGFYSETRDSHSEASGSENNQEPTKELQKVDLTRDDVESSDNISNNRFAIWKDAITIWKTTPVIGATSRGYLEYAKDKIGDLYIVERSYAIHNGYLSTLLFSGILGTAVMVVWLGFLLYRIIKYLVYKSSFRDSEYMEVVLLFAGILSMGAATMLLSMVFYETMISGAIFWMMCGYILDLTKNPQKEKRTNYCEYM